VEKWNYKEVLRHFKVWKYEMEKSRIEGEKNENNYI